MEEPHDAASSHIVT